MPTRRVPSTTMTAPTFHSAMSSAALLTVVPGGAVSIFLRSMTLPTR